MLSRTALKTTSPSFTPNNFRHQLQPPWPEMSTGSGVLGLDGCSGMQQPCILATAPTCVLHEKGKTHGNYDHATLASAPDADDAPRAKPRKAAPKRHSSWLAQQAYVGAYCTVRSTLTRGAGRAVVALPSNSISELGLIMLRQASGSSDAVLTIDGIAVTVEMNMKFPGWFLRWDVPSGRSAALSEERIASKFDTFIEQLVAIERSECAPTDEMVPTCNLD
eukprot:TRINITY_DN7167_c0_g3_i2.p1 TRINITY_DN7167_c0_g3~~TRINITY_DN7167_c0_g3_i2.p1  ORF type:complete len:251 (+),score=30.24 TRINITY_DN7167_c0_g3_i2:91-753(+)